MAEKRLDAFIAVGSNIDPERHILEALRRLARRLSVTGVSTFYRTAPLDRPDQPPFLNGVWRIDAPVPARAIKFDYLRPIETELGRVRTADKFAARTIDLDLILYGDAVINEPGLKIPDPDLRTRPFIGIPALALAPDLVLPDTGERLASILPSVSANLQPAPDFTARLRKTASEFQLGAGCVPRPFTKNEARGVNG